MALHRDTLTRLILCHIKTYGDPLSPVRQFFHRTGLGAVMAVWLSTAVFAESADSTPNEQTADHLDDRPTVSFIWENDSFANTDRNYTNGMRVSWLSGQAPTGGFSTFIANILGPSEGTVRRRGFALGQTIFTPEDIEETEFLADQHPYAGWLYAEMNAVLERPDVVDTFALQFGIVGPSALGETAQNNFHTLLGIDEAQGWDNQIPDEVGINFSYDRKIRSRRRLQLGDWRADLTPNAGFTLGTIYTNAHIGLTARIGPRIGDDFGPPRVAPSLGGAGYFKSREGFGWYGFAGIQTRFVAHNMIRDGSLFREGTRTISSRDWVNDIQIGLVLQYNDVQASLTLVQRSKEFNEQSSPQQFGAFTIARKF